MQRKIQLLFRRSRAVALRLFEKISISNCKRSDSKIFICGRWVGAIDLNRSGRFGWTAPPLNRYATSLLLPDYCRCHGCVTFWIRGLHLSLTKTNASVFASGRLNLYTPGPLQDLGIAPALRVS